MERLEQEHCRRGVRGIVSEYHIVFGMHESVQDLRPHDGHECHNFVQTEHGSHALVHPQNGEGTYPVEVHLGEHSEQEEDQEVFHQICISSLL